MGFLLDAVSRTDAERDIQTRILQAVFPDESDPRHVRGEVNMERLPEGVDKPQRKKMSVVIGRVHRIRRRHLVLGEEAVSYCNRLQVLQSRPFKDVERG